METELAEVEAAEEAGGSDELEEDVVAYCCCWLLPWLACRVCRDECRLCGALELLESALPLRCLSCRIRRDDGGMGEEEEGRLTL